MNSFVQQMIQKKLKQVHPSDLLDYGEEYGIPLTEQQAKQISAYLKNTNLNPTNEKDRMQFFKKLAQITDIKTAQKAQKLFNQLIKDYGVQSWFD
ncbi:DUF2624 domain-containing protein [Aquibacillus sediminis]|uniref:DUF2624 domain-containing protein n=1 Tax=Aquibacillus sediminis TaxID=2574734 RepID=UPI001109DC01|nr:DUF2624 domain-containing protein [Aquibacillus sediminis]